MNSSPSTAVPKHFANLTRGLLCNDLPSSDVHFSRIQSTHCEQKRWAQVITGAGPDLLMSLARGESVVVHDLSERDRETRACWQGLSLIRYACERYWQLPHSAILGRGGKAMQQYFASVLRSNPEIGVILRYYRQFNPTRVALDSCWRISRDDA